MSAWESVWNVNERCCPKQTHSHTTSNIEGTLSGVHVSTTHTLFILFWSLAQRTSTLQTCTTPSSQSHRDNGNASTPPSFQCKGISIPPLPNYSVESEIKEFLGSCLGKWSWKALSGSETSVIKGTKTGHTLKSRFHTHDGILLVRIWIVENICAEFENH